MVNLILHASDHYLKPILNNNEIPLSSLEVLGQSLLVRNISTLIDKVRDIDTISISNNELYFTISRLIQKDFPSIAVKESESSKYGSYDYNSKIEGNEINTTKDILIDDIKNKDNIIIPINSLVYYGNDKDAFTIQPIIYPWDFLNAVKRILQNEVTQTVISPTASISKTSVIDGPCIIEDGAVIDDFCKIKGPTYIGKDCLIGMNSLIRGSMVGKETRIGFNCEIAKSFLAGHDRISHLNLIMDTIIGDNVWFGGYSGTSNTTVTAKNIMYEIDNGKTVDTGTDHFGAVIGNNCTIGTNVMILPGRNVPSNTMIQAITKTYQVNSK